MLGWLLTTSRFFYFWSTVSNEATCIQYFLASLSWFSFAFLYIHIIAHSELLTPLLLYIAAAELPIWNSLCSAYCGKERLNFWLNLSVLWNDQLITFCFFMCTAGGWRLRRANAITSFYNRSTSLKLFQTTKSGNCCSKSSNLFVWMMPILVSFTLSSLFIVWGANCANFLITIN